VNVRVNCINFKQRQCCLLTSLAWFAAAFASAAPDAEARPATLPDDLITAGERVAHRVVRENKVGRNYRVDLALEALLDFSVATGRPEWRGHVFDALARRGTKPDSPAPYRSQPFGCLTFALYRATGDRAWLPEFLRESELCRRELPRSPEGAVMHPRGSQRGGGDALLIDAMQEYAARVAVAGALVGDADYFRESAAQFRRYRDILRDPKTGLWSQGRGWLSGQPLALSPGAWSRGHGWLLRGLTAALAELPRDSAEFKELQGTLRELADALLPLQQAGGLWHTLLHRPPADSPPDVSGTAMMASALSRAWRARWLPEARVREAAQRAFAALPAFVDREGVVLSVSPGPGPLESEADYLVKEFPPGNDHGPFTLLFAAAEAARLAKASAPASTTRPNILFIIVDDQSPLDFRIYNPRATLQTPNIDRLAVQGMTFDGAYHMGAFVSGVCLPSRYMIKSGRTLWHLPVAPEAAKHCPPNLESNTIAAVFNRAGYDTMRTGKPGNSYEAAKRLFTVNKESKGRSGTQPDGSAWHGQQVLDYLDERAAAKDRDPFLIYFGFSHPHDPRNGTDEMLAKYGAVNHTNLNSLPPANPKQPPLPANYLPAHPFPTTLLPDQRDETQAVGVWTNRDERTIRNEIGRYFACSEEIDRQIGRVLTKLDAMGELDNTYIFYTSDHGIAIGRHGLQGKQNLYQHTWRVPFIAKGPGIKPGTRAEGNIYLLDVLATLCDIAGIAPPETNEGISFKPVLEGRRSTMRDVLYGVHCGGTKPGMRCVKKGDWKLIQYDGNNGAVHETQLFNLAENPDELLQEHHDPAVIALTGVTPAIHQVNLAGDPRYAAKLAEMEALLLSEMRRRHDPYRLWNQPNDGLTPPPEITRPVKGKVSK
jgi:arylsulfatase A-like enzyme/rhamnogalacturonyl hydrolase YesR